MTNSQEWFEIPHRTYGATTAIYQVGQVITDPLDLDSALFRNGSFDGKPSHELSQTFRQGKALAVAYSNTAPSFEVTTGHSIVIEEARVDGKGVPVLWQVLEAERIYSNDTLLRAVIQEEDVTRYLARPDSRKRLYLVTGVIKVQEFIPECYGSGMLKPDWTAYLPPYMYQSYQPRPTSPYPASSAHFAGTSTSEDPHLPVGFDGRKNGKPFVWKYKLERINNPEDVELVFAERYFPSQAKSDRVQTNWIVLILTFLLGWMWSPFQQKTVPNERAGDSSALPARPTTLKWRVERENLTSNSVGEPNGAFSQMNPYGLASRLPPAPLAPSRKSAELQPVSTDDEMFSLSDQSYDDFVRRLAKRRVSRSRVSSPTRIRIRTRRRASEGWREEREDSSDWESKSVSFSSPWGHQRMARRRVRAKSRGPTAPVVREPYQPTPDTVVGLGSVESASIPEGLEKDKMAERDSQSMKIQDGLGEGQAIMNGAGNNETVVGSKAEHLEKRSPTELPAVPAILAMPALGSPVVGMPHTEYDVFDSVAADLASALSQGDDAIKEGKKWFDDAEYMKKVNRFFDASRKGKVNERAKIAVLDTGLDFDHLLLQPFLESRKLSREHSLDFTMEPNMPVKDDTVGHGTHCTHLILKTCETAEVYVAKVFKKKKADQCTAMCVAKAIDHAVNYWKVDIISMSFAFSLDQKPILEAIERAQKADKKVLFLAAASNFRLLAHNPVGFPANYNNVISVFSHTLGRVRSKFSPARPGAQNFSVLGEHLNAAFPKALNEGDYERRQSGTSMATALMAGIAGLVIEFSRLSAISEKVTDPDRLLRRAGMEAVFRLMMPPSELRSPDADSYLYLRPWILFRAPRPEDPWNVVYEIDKALGSSARSG